MTYRQKCRIALIHDEGLMLKPYQDLKGKWTIGVGRNLTDNGISKDTALAMLEEDIDKAEVDVKTIFPQAFYESLSDNRKVALVSLLFNLGKPRFLTFKKTIAAIKLQDWYQVESGLKLSLWAQQVKSRAERVIMMLVKDRFPYE